MMTSSLTMAVQSPPLESHSDRAPLDPFDAEWARSLECNVLRPMNETWFRAKLVGAEKIPSTGPLILAANHSGNAFPYDAMALDSVLWQHDGMRDDSKLRTVYEPELSSVWWMRPYGIDDFWRRGGGVDMTFDNFDRLLERRDRVLYFPEGVPGIGKGFNNRYRLQRFRTSFLLLAARHHTPVLPIYIINGEWLHPCGYVFRPLDRLMQRLFHVPFLPLPLGIAAIILPWIWYLAFPARLVFVVGEPINVEAILRDEGITTLDSPDRAALRRAAEGVRITMQHELTRYAEQYGNSPYEVKSLISALWRARRELLRATPLGWPVTFLRHERARHRPPARNALRAFVRDLDLAGFYLPFGWPLLSITRALRKPPCGYRGVPAAECRERRGEYLWRLADRPLPGNKRNLETARVNGLHGF